MYAALVEGTAVQYEQLPGRRMNFGKILLQNLFVPLIWRAMFHKIFIMYIFNNHNWLWFLAIVCLRNEKCVGCKQVFDNKYFKAITRRLGFEWKRFVFRKSMQMGISYFAVFLNIFQFSVNSNKTRSSHANKPFNMILICRTVRELKQNKSIMGYALWV